MKENLIKLLADQYALYLKTQNYHWNVEGKDFKVLHSLFEELYKDLGEAIDTLAEIIRALDLKTPATFELYSKLASIKAGDENASSRRMVEELLEDQGKLGKSLDESLEAAKKIGDEVVADFIIERLGVHRKNAWILKSILRD